MFSSEWESRHAIYIVTELLEGEGERVFSEGTFRDLWECLARILNTPEDTLLLEHLKRNPNDPETQKEIKNRLKTRIEQNWGELQQLHTLNRAVGLHYDYYFVTNTEFDTASPAGTVDTLPGREKMRHGLTETAKKSHNGLRFNRSRVSRYIFARPKNSCDGPGALPPLPPVPLSRTPMRPKMAISRKDSNRYVNTGFSSWEDPDKPLNRNIPLATGQPYLFFLNVKELDKNSIEENPSELPGIAEENPLITVVVFGFDGGIRVTPGADRGELLIPGRDPGRVIRPPIPDGNPVPASRLRELNLFFPVFMPDTPGPCRMRCNIYWKNILLQSRLVTVTAVEHPPAVPMDHPQSSSVMDYSIAGTLSPSHINQLEGHRMSLLLNTNGDGSQSIFIAGTDGHHHLTFGGEEIQDLIEKSRAQLRIVSWGNENDWHEGISYRFKDRKPDLDRLRMSLIPLAKWGYQFYFKAYCRLGDDQNMRDAFEEQMKIPGFIQIAMRQSPNYLLPAARFYDYPLNISKKPEEYTLCPCFEKAFRERTALEDIPCFQGACPTREKMTELQDAREGYKCTTICPSGFWGFRHFIGMPITIHAAETVPDIPPGIPVREQLTISACIASNMQLLGDHEKALMNMKTFGPSVQVRFADEEAEVFEALQKVSPHIVYFYCHGDLSQGLLQLQLGSREHPVIMNDSNLKTNEIIWTDPRPLVFLNGCETAGLEPRQAFSFIEPLVTYSHCAGVIGTEITIFEELATEFSEQFFERFLAGEPIGKAIRHARLALLGQGNPLGLVYNPYVIPSLKLSKAGPGG